MKTIEIVTHCWAGRFRHFADALTYQLSSLILHPPRRCEVVLTAYLACGDEAAEDVVVYFKERLSELWESSVDYPVTIQFRSLPIRELGRRSIGRNDASRRTEADLVWFADVDMTFGEGCLDALAGLPWPDGATMVWPREIRISRDHVTGDAQLARIGGHPAAVDVDPAEFVPLRYGRAIGGVQIVRGEFARRHGYLGGEAKWQRPTDEPFGDFRDDVAYRGFCKTLGFVRAIDLPNLYRIRHSQTTYQEDK